MLHLLDGSDIDVPREAVEARGSYAAGKVDERAVQELNKCTCPGEGACAGLFTANSMDCVTYALGLSLVGCGEHGQWSQETRDRPVNQGDRSSVDK